MFSIKSFARSDTGRKRSNNEDAFLSRDDLGLSVVADGMGGAAAGELASRIFAESALEVFSQTGVQSEQESLDLIRRSYRLANRRILEHAKENPQHDGMGCTAEMLIIYGQKFAVGHVGDSRTYLYRKGKLQQLTQDHSLVQDQLNHGLITQEEARKHRFRNVILRAVGTQDDLSVDIVRGRAFLEDIFLLCSDGLTDMVPESSIQDVLSQPGSLSEKASQLIELANSAGGHDNITVVLSEVADMQCQESTDSRMPAT